METADYKRGVEEFVALLLKNVESPEEIVAEVERYMAHSAQETEKELKQLRTELEYERNKYQQARNAFLSQITDRSELETFFFECLGEMRKEILHRGPRGLLPPQDAEHQHEASAEHEAGVKPDKTGSTLLNAQRFQALQAVLSNDRILITLFDEIFGPPSKREEYPMLFQKPTRGLRDPAVKPSNLITPGASSLSFV
jgi:hypothetical protein